MKEKRNIKSCLIFANGKYENSVFYKNLVESHKDAFIIAVDGGLNFLDKIDKKPDLIIGDLDSVNPEILNNYLDIKKEKYLSRKDFTDTEKALDYSVKEKFNNVLLLGSTSLSRMDHSLANIYLLEKYSPLIKNLELVNENNILSCLKGPAQKELYLEIGTTVSLISLTQESTGITLKGFDYPLEDATLYRMSSLGISNITKESKQKISLEKGTLLIDIVFEKI